MPSGMWKRVGSRKQVLDGGAHWHHLANTIEPSMCGLLSNYFDHLFNWPAFLSLVQVGLDSEKVRFETTGAET